MVYTTDAQKEKVEGFLADLLSIGFTRAQINEKGYEYALALQAEKQKADAPVTASMMEEAAKLVKDALPGAYRIYERRTMMR